MRVAKGGGGLPQVLKLAINGVHGTPSFPVNFNGFQTLVLLFSNYSTSVSSLRPASNKKNPLLENYLVNSLGFSQDVAVKVFTKLLRYKSLEKPQKVVDFLKSTGLDEAQIRRVVKSYPVILFSDVQKTLEPKVKVFRDLGLTGSDLALSISANPLILSRGLESHIVPAITFLKSIVSSHDNLVKVLLKAQWWLSGGSFIFLRDNVTFLFTIGVSALQIEKHILQRPYFLSGNHKRFKIVTKRVENELGFAPKSPMFLHGLQVLSAVCQKKMESRLDIYRSFGCSDSDVWEMVRRFPYCLTLSEKLIKSRMKYFIQDHGYSPSFLAMHPVLLRLSMERRIIPRHTVLNAMKEKGLVKRDLCLYSFVVLKESDFLNKYIIPYMNEVPGLREDYLDKVVSKIPKKQELM